MTNPYPRAEIVEEDCSTNCEPVRVREGELDCTLMADPPVAVKVDACMRKVRPCEELPDPTTANPTAPCAVTALLVMVTPTVLTDPPTDTKTPPITVEDRICTKEDCTVLSTCRKLPAGCSVTTGQDDTRTVLEVSVCPT